MSRTTRTFALLVAMATALAAGRARAEGDGQADLDEATRLKVTVEGLRDLNKVIVLLETALDKGLDVENSDFAEQVLAESLLERAGQLTAVVRGVPEAGLANPRMQQVRRLAVSDLRRVLTYDNPPPQGAAMLAQLMAMPGGDRDEAFKLLEELIAKESFASLPPDERAESIALRATLQAEPEKALADFAAAIELAPEELEFRLARAEYQFEQQQFDEALAEIAEVVAQDPTNAEAFLLQAQIQRGQQKLDDALASLDKARELTPESPIAYQYRGEILREQEKYDRAIEEFSRVLQLEPGFGLALIRRAEAYLMAEKLDEALADVEMLLKDNPGLTIAQGLRAQILASKNRLPEAIADMKSLADAMPTQPEYRMQLALYYLLNDQPRRAIAAYTEVLAIEPQNFLALRSRGDAHLNIGDHAAAIADFETALPLSPDDSPLLNNFAWVLATSPDDAVRNGARAVELAAKACELTSYERPHILSTLASAYAEHGDFDNAKKWSQKAIELNKSDPNDDISKELAAELASYETGKPWRERQTQDEHDPTAGAGEPLTEASPPAAEKSSQSAEAPAKAPGL